MKSFFYTMMWGAIALVVIRLLATFPFDEIFANDQPGYAGTIEEAVEMCEWASAVTGDALILRQTGHSTEKTIVTVIDRYDITNTSDISQVHDMVDNFSDALEIANIDVEKMRNATYSGCMTELQSRHHY